MPSLALALCIRAVFLPLFMHTGTNRALFQGKKEHGTKEQWSSMGKKGEKKREKNMKDIFVWSELTRPFYCQCVPVYLFPKGVRQTQTTEEMYCQLGFIDFTAHSSDAKLCMWLLWNIQNVCLHVQHQNNWKKRGKDINYLALSTNQQALAK